MDNALYVQTENVMGNDIFIYLVQFPSTDIHEAVMPCVGGYTVYLDARLSDEGKKRAYRHAIGHILHNDFSKDNVGEIELKARGLSKN